MLGRRAILNAGEIPMYDQSTVRIAARRVLKSVCNIASGVQFMGTSILLYIHKSVLSDPFPRRQSINEEKTSGSGDMK